MIIDFHIHTFPDKMAEHTISKLERSAHLTAFADGTVHGLIASMKESGIDLSVILPVVTNPPKADEINEYAAEANSEHPEIHSFGGIHPDTENYRDVLKRAKGLGLKGIKLHPEFQGVDFDDIRYKRILSSTEELGLITLVHAGFDGSYPDSQRCWTRHILNVIEDVKPKKLVVAHMGGCNIWDEVKKNLAGAEVYFDTAFSFGEKQLSGLLSEEQFISLSRTHGTKKILFGTDSPWCEQKEMTDFVKNSSLTEEEKSDILGLNAKRLLDSVQ